MWNNKGMTIKQQKVMIEMKYPDRKQCELLERNDPTEKEHWKHKTIGRGASWDKAEQE